MWFGKDPFSISQDICNTGMHHVTHLDLIDIDQKVFPRARPMVTCNPVEKNSYHLMLQSHNLYILGNVPLFHPGKNFFPFGYYIPLDNHWIDYSYQF